MGEGESEKTWITKASFNPEGKRKSGSLTKQFDKFETIGDYTYPILRIYGLEGKNEEKIYEMAFHSRDLMLHVYSSLGNVLESKAKIKTLAELLAKTSVPVIKEVNKTTAELTPNESFLVLFNGFERCQKGVCSLYYPGHVHRFTIHAYSGVMKACFAQGQIRLARQKTDYKRRGKYYYN